MAEIYIEICVEYSILRTLSGKISIIEYSVESYFMSENGLS